MDNNLAAKLNLTDKISYSSTQKIGCVLSGVPGPLFCHFMEEETEAGVVRALCCFRFWPSDKTDLCKLEPSLHHCRPNLIRA